LNIFLLNDYVQGDIEVRHQTFIELARNKNQSHSHEPLKCATLDLFYRWRPVMRSIAIIPVSD
jgi:hypothetical protein